MPSKIITKDGEMLDIICLKYYGIASGVVESVLAYNVDIAGYGDILPAGVEIILPDIELPVENVDVVKLWD